MQENETSPFGEPAPWATSVAPAPRTSPFGAPAPWASVAPPPPVSVAPAGGMYELRPLSLGEILDRTFMIYRRRFWLFAGLSTVAAACSTLITLARLSIFGAVQPTVPGKAAAAPNMHQFYVGMAIACVAVLLYLVAFGLTQAATVSAVFAVYLGEDTSIGRAFRKVRRHWFRYILIMLWQGWSAMWLPTVLLVPAAFLTRSPSLLWLSGLLFFLFALSLIYAPFAIIRNSLGIVASAVEDLKVRKSMRRSKDLVAGHKARVLGIGLLAYVLSLAAGVAQAIFTFSSQASHGALKVVFEAIALLVTFVTISMVTPVSAIALSLFYIDERVRKEGFDLEVLMGGDAPAAATEVAAMASPFSGELA
jgi:hypothetical protein